MAYEEGGWRRKAQIGYYAFAEKVATPLVRVGSPRRAHRSRSRLFYRGGVLFGLGEIFWGGVVLFFSGIMDPLDGTVARLTAKRHAPVRSSIPQWTGTPSFSFSLGFSFISEAAGCSTWSCSP